MRRYIGVICCAAIAALTSVPAPADGAGGNAYAPEPGPSRNDKAAEDARRQPAADPAARPAHVRDHWRGRDTTSARAPERQRRVYWRSDRGRVKSRSDFAPN